MLVRYSFVRQRAGTQKRLASKRVPFPNLVLPVVQAPMFLVSQTNQVVSSCSSGIVRIHFYRSYHFFSTPDSRKVGTFPALNAKSTEILDSWLTEIQGRLEEHEKGGRKSAPYGINLIVHKYVRDDFV